MTQNIRMIQTRPEINTCERGETQTKRHKLLKDYRTGTSMRMSAGSHKVQKQLEKKRKMCSLKQNI